MTGAEDMKMKTVSKKYFKTKLDVTSVNIIKEEIKIRENLPVTDYPFLWFAGKRNTMP